MTLLREAAGFHKTGDKEKARALLLEASEINPQNELVWLWQASLARTAVEAMAAVEKVLELNPSNEKAIAWKQKLEPKLPSRAPQEKVPLNGHAIVARFEEETAEAAEKTDQDEQIQEEAEVADEEAKTEEVAVVINDDNTEATEELIGEEVVAEGNFEEDAIYNLAAKGIVEDDSEDALAALEVESSERSIQESESKADFWDQVDDDARAADDNDDATIRALEALDQYVAETHVAETNIEEAEEDPIRRLLAEREASCTYDADSEEPWNDEENKESDGGSNEASLLALLTQDHVGVTDLETIEALEESVEKPAETEEAITEGEGEETPELITPIIKTHWECLLCGQQSHRVESYCPACKAIGDITRLADMARNEEVDRVSLKRFIAEWEDQAETDPTAKIYTKLALGYLNLRQSNAALPHLLAAARLDRSNDALASALEQVSRRPLILVVDDSRTVQRMVLSTLEKELFRVQIAEDGLQALAKLNEETPSLILLDITMPRMDGYQVCKVITGNDSFKHIPVVMLSGKDGFFDKVRGRMVGAKDYITKPFEAEALVKAVRKRIDAPVG